MYKQGTTLSANQYQADSAGDGSGSRIFMVLETGNKLVRPGVGQLSIFRQKFHNSVSRTFRHFEAKIISQDSNEYLVLFPTASNAVLCALKIQSDFKYITPKFDEQNRRFKIGISTGSPQDKDLCDARELISAVLYLCDFPTHEIVITSDIKALYEKENRKAHIDKNHIRSLAHAEEEMLINLLQKANTLWQSPQFTVSTLSRELGFSPAQFRRRLKRLTGKSPNIFIREFRLKRALDLMHGQFGQISQIAKASGFQSPSYFTKCFRASFGIRPSRYNQLLKA